MERGFSDSPDAENDRSFWLKLVFPALLTTACYVVAIFGFILPAVESTYMASRQGMLTELTETAWSMLSSLNEQVIRGELSMDEARKLAKERIGALRYGPEGKDYFWINDMDAAMVVHPYRPDLDGADVSDFKDSEGKTLFAEFVRQVKDKGAGFVDYKWQWKDDPTRIASKLSYVKGFEPWGWIVGTGVYIDDVHQDLAAFKRELTVISLLILLLAGGSVAYLVRQNILAERKRRAIQLEREELIKELAASEERYRTVADFTYHMESWQDPSGHMRYVSPSCERITGYPARKFLEDPGFLETLVHPEDVQVFQRHAKADFSEEGLSVEFRIHRKDTRLRWLCMVSRDVIGPSGLSQGVRSSIRDITDRKLMERRLRYQALHDPLTGLANRSLCLDRVERAMERALRRQNYYYAVVFMDIDRFKVINDSLGHAYGDKLLVEVAERLIRSVRGLDTVARYGGDEFVLLLEELSSPSEAISIIKRIRAYLKEPFTHSGHNVKTSASFGIVLSPTAYERAEDLLQNANIAMHASKKGGRDRFKVFTGKMLETAVEVMTLENDLHRGLDNDEFFVQYQPILSVLDRKLDGFEALVRWNHPERGVLQPNTFIPVAEETGLIIPLGEWVLREAATTMARWLRTHDDAESLCLSVNLSAKQFGQSSLADKVADILTETGLPAKALKLEVTESAVMENAVTAQATLNRLKKLGVQISIDDFGTGYSSLSYLQRLPVDTLKVDRSFVSRMGLDEGNNEIVRSVIALAHSLGLDVVAEGVEEELQLSMLKELKCERVQGFYFFRPMDESDMEALICKPTSDGRLVCGLPGADLPVVGVGDTDIPKS